MRQYPAKNII